MSLEVRIHYPPRKIVKEGSELFGPTAVLNNRRYSRSLPASRNRRHDPHEFVNRADDPELHDLVRQLHYRALQGWDPERALGILKRRKRDYDIMADWQQANYSPDREVWPTPTGSNVWPEE